MTVYRACSLNQQYTCNKLLSAYCVTLAINMYQSLFQCIVQIKKASLLGVLTAADCCHTFLKGNVIILNQIR